MRPQGQDADASTPRRVVLRLKSPEPAIKVAASRWGRTWDLIVQEGGVRAGSPPDGADVLIVETDPQDPADFAAFETLARDLSGHVPVIAAVRDLTVAATRAALRAGAADIVPLPLSETDISNAVAAIPPRTGAPRVQRAGQMVAIMGAHGGCGATAIATQTAAFWAGKAKTCLIDLDLQFGSAALYLDMKPPLSIADIVFAGARLDADLFAQVAATHVTGLDVVAAPPETPPLDLLGPAAMDRIIDLAKSHYDAVVLDLPRAWIDWSLRAIERADVLLLVTSLSVAGIDHARRQLAVIAENNLSDKVRLVANRVEPPLLGKPNLREPERLLGRGIDATVSNEPDTMGPALDLGKPLAGGRGRGRLEKDLRALTELISQPALREATP